MRKCRNLDPFRHKITHEMITSQQKKKKKHQKTHKKPIKVDEKKKSIKNIPSFMSKTAIVT